MRVVKRFMAEMVSPRRVPRVLSRPLGESSNWLPVQSTENVPALETSHKHLRLVVTLPRVSGC